MTPDRTATEIAVKIDREHGPTLVTAAHLLAGAHAYGRNDHGAEE